jgi:PadR family transcriptional regulator, regulatory protein PadR
MKRISRYSLQVNKNSLTAIFALYYLYCKENGRWRLMMEFLSRPEELILLAIGRLDDTAYCVPIRVEVSKMTGKDWSFGAVYVPLDRLEKKGMITSRLGPSTPTRGGRSKRFYRITSEGLKALAEVNKLHQTAWAGFPKPALD